VSGNPLAIGIDLGTSSLKAVAVDADGKCHARARASYPTRQPDIGAAEQDPADWLSACDTAMSRLAAQTDPAVWQTIGLSGMLPTLVSISAEGTPIGSAITWEDGRAEDDGDRITELVGAQELYRRTGQRFDGRYLLAMHARRVRFGLPPETMVAGAKDYLFAHLTGRLLTDPSTAAGYGAYDLIRQQWDEELLSAAAVTSVPDIVPSQHSYPLLTSSARRWGCAPGIPVVIGAADSVLGAYGLGVHQAGDVAYIAGTSNVILGFSPSIELDGQGRYLVTPMADVGYGLEMDLLATGAAAQWLAELLGLDGPAALIELAATASLDTAPLILPYLSPGEQGALWDPNLTGVIAGLTLASTRADLARGLLTGIVLESRRCLAVLAEASGTAGQILMSGSGAASTTFRRDLADATGRTVSFQPCEQDHSALGAALFAGRSALHWPADTAQRRADIVEPNPAQARGWAQRYEHHELLRRSVPTSAHSPGDERFR